MKRLQLYHHALYDILAHGRVRQNMRFNHDALRFERYSNREDCVALADTEAVAPRLKKGEVFTTRPEWHLMDDVYLTRKQAA